MQSTESILINGTHDEAFAAVREEFERNFRERGEIGAAVVSIATASRSLTFGADTRIASEPCHGSGTPSSS